MPEPTDLEVMHAARLAYDICENAARAMERRHASEAAACYERIVEARVLYLEAKRSL